MHPEGHHAEYLSFDELTRVIKAFTELGVKKIRLTGGEPLVRKGLAEFAADLKRLPGLVDIALSTNAHYLAREAAALAPSVNRVNISIDSLNASKFKHITRGGDLQKVMMGIDAAIEQDMHPVKLNMVVMRGTNDDEIEAMVDFGLQKKVEVRFIETMPIGPAGVSMMDQHYSASDILKRIKQHVGKDLIPALARSHDGPARNYLIGDTGVKIGVISAVSQHFCETCNRVRLTARGVLALCLGQADSVDLRAPIRDGASDEDLKALIVAAIAKKPERHFFNENVHNIEFRQMVSLGG